MICRLVNPSRSIADMRHATAQLPQPVQTPSSTFATIRAFFAQGLTPDSDLELVPERYWISDDGVALTWIMSATVRDDTYGAENKGKKWRVMGMSSLDFNKDDLIVREVDYWTSTDIPRSLGAKP